MSDDALTRAEEAELARRAGAGPDAERGGSGMVIRRAKQAAINKRPSQVATDRIEAVGNIQRELSLNGDNSTTD